MGFFDWFYDTFIWRRSQQSDGGLGAAVGKTINKQADAPKPKARKRIGVIVGHEKSAPGAKLCAPYNVHEYEYNSEIAQLMKEYGETRGAEVLIIFRDGIGISGAYQKSIAENCHAVIELHFNSYDGHVYGTETLCSSAPEDKRLATIVQNAMVSLFGRSGRGDRGVKITDTGRGAQSCVSFPGRANCLVEPGFGDNPQDAKMLVQFKRPYAHALIDAVLETF